MSFDSDVILIGTGLAPLIGASHLVSQGKSVLILNPDRDFFLEDSELPLDPMLNLPFDPARALAHSPENVLKELRPFFPGAVETWGDGAAVSGFHDVEAPHVRQRARLWFSLGERLDEVYVEALDHELKPTILNGTQATKRLPGVSTPWESDAALFLPKTYDVDVLRYRNGVLEFIRERLGSNRVRSGVSQLEPMPGGVRFHSEGGARTARARDGVLVYWTPRLTPWVLKQAKHFEARPIAPRGARVWEQWSLMSRDPLDPGVVAAFGEEFVVWAETEGSPKGLLDRLSVLRAGPLVGLDELVSPQTGENWASAESFESLSKLCHDFLKWEKFSIRAMTPRLIFEWDSLTKWELRKAASEEDRFLVIPGCDGPIVDVVRTATEAAERLSEESIP